MFWSRKPKIVDLYEATIYPNVGYSWKDLFKEKRKIMGKNGENVFPLGLHEKDLYETCIKNCIVDYSTIFGNLDISSKLVEDLLIDEFWKESMKFQSISAPFSGTLEGVISKSKFICNEKCLHIALNSEMFNCSSTCQPVNDKLESTVNSVAFDLAKMNHFHEFKTEINKTLGGECSNCKEDIDLVHMELYEGYFCCSDCGNTLTNEKQISDIAREVIKKVSKN